MNSIQICVFKSICVLIIISCVQSVFVLSQQNSSNAIERILFRPWPVKCFVCNSIDDGLTCIQSVSFKLLCESPSGMCYTNIMDGKVMRGCVGDELFPNDKSIRKCADGVKCEVCNRDFCNQKILTDTCIQCNGADQGSECRDNPNIKMQAVCTMGQNSITNPSSGCYLGKTGGGYQRGCLQDLKSRDKKTCESQSNECKTCFAPNCNQKVDFNINCYECNGEVDDGCVDGLNLKQVQCNDFSNTCVTGIDVKGFTHRRCIFNYGLAFAVPFLKYKPCYSNLCNDKIYPENRLKCHQCQGSGCDNLNTISTLKLCSNAFYAYDRCYTYIDKGICNFSRTFQLFHRF